MAIYPDDIREVIRHMPLISIHDKASLAHQAAEAAGAQGLFWEMADLLVERQGEWRGQSVEEFQQTLIGYAQEVGVPDLAGFEADLANETYAAEMETIFNDNLAAGVRSTPTIFINGIPWQGSFDIATLSAGVESILVASQYPEAPPLVIAEDTTYYATIVTDSGDIMVELFAALSPQTVNNFIYLACSGYYDNNTFHNVLPEFAAQTGDPTGTGWGSPNYSIPDEADNGLVFDRSGLLTMALRGGYPNSASGQFFITYGPQEQLNGLYTVFGEVIAGMDVLESLQPRDPQTDPEAPPGSLLETIIIQEQG